MAMGLTPRQIELLGYLRSYITEHGYAPTYREMNGNFGFGLQRIHELILGLEERGSIRRLPNRRRAIEVVEAAPNPAGLAAYSTAELRAEIERRAKA